MPQHSHRSNMLVPYLGRAELSKAEASNKLLRRCNLLETSAILSSVNVNIRRIVLERS